MLGLGVCGFEIAEDRAPMKAEAHHVLYFANCCYCSSFSCCLGSDVVQLSLVCPEKPTHALASLEA